MNNLEEEYSRTIRHLATYPENKTHISKELLEYWLLNHSDTFFCCGRLRRIVPEMITSKVYLLKSEEV